MPQQQQQCGDLQEQQEIMIMESNSRCIPPILLAQMKLEAGVDDREISTLSYEEKARLNVVFRRTMDNYNGVPGSAPRPAHDGSILLRRTPEDSDMSTAPIIMDGLPRNQQDGGYPGPSAPQQQQNMPVNPVIDGEPNGHPSRQTVPADRTSPSPVMNSPSSSPCFLSGGGGTLCTLD